MTNILEYPVVYNTIWRTQREPDRFSVISDYNSATTLTDIPEYPALPFKAKPAVTPIQQNSSHFEINAPASCLTAMTKVQEKSHTMEQERKSSKVFNLNPKHIKFDEDERIGRFFANIEAYSIDNGIKSDTDKIHIACKCLSAS